MNTSIFKRPHTSTSIRTLAPPVFAGVWRWPLACASLALGLLAGAANAQTLPVAHWINGSGQEADTVLNNGKVFTTSFKANNDLKVTQLSGEVNSVYLDTFGGDSPGNNPAWLTGFVGVARNDTGDGTPGDVEELEMDIDDDTASLQFDFSSHLGPNDRILLADVDGDEAYQIKAYTVDASSHYTAVSLSGWVAQQYSGSTGQLPDSTWPIWNGAAGTLVSGTSGDTLDEEVCVLVPDKNIDRLVITKTAGGGYSTSVQFFSLGSGDTTKPTVAITSPTSGQKVSNAAFTLKGTAHDNTQVQAVWCQVGGVWTQATTANGWANWTLPVTLSAGTNSFAACAVDTSGNWSAVTQKVSMVYVVTDTLRVSASALCTMSPNYSNAVLQIGKSYTTTVTPAKGYILSNWVCTAQGSCVVCTTPKLTFTMQSNLVLRANIVPNPFLAVKGSYNGLWEELPRAQSNSGLLTLTLATDGTYSGTVKQGTNKYAFAGQFDLGGVAYQVVSRPKTNPWVLGMGLHFADQQVRGWLSNAVSGGGVAEFVTDRAVWDAHTNPATAYAGKYTATLPGGGSHSGAMSLGDGYLTLAVDTGGNVTYSGSLADGTAVGPFSVPVSAAGNVPIYVPLYVTKGSLWGWLSFESGQPSAGLSGALSWIKHEQAGACYPAGLTNGMTIEGARYTPPANATTRAVAITNGMLVFEGGSLAQPLTNLFTLSSGNKITDVTLANKLSASLTVANGVFSGSVREPGQTKSCSFSGVLLQDGTCGYGSFLETNMSGRVSLLSATAAAAPIASYSPLAVGDSWTIHFTALNAPISYTQVDEIIGTDSSSGTTWYEEQATAPGISETSYFRNDADGLLCYTPFETTPYYIIKGPLAVGNTWTMTAGLHRTITQLGATTTVPAGTFNNCLLITQTYDNNPGFSVLEWFAPGKGQVRQESWQDGTLVDLWVETAIVIK